MKKATTPTIPSDDPFFGKQPNPLVRSFTTRVTTEDQDSRCWLAAKVRFRERVNKTKHPPSPDHINDFLRNNVNVNKAIAECEKLKAKADKRYEGKIGKLLGVLSLLKDTGDAVLTCAPETVSIAWGIISLFVGIGTNDMENCGQISEASTNIVTIILNCRLYENRHQYSKDTEESGDLAKRVIEAIEELITVILEFFWHASRKFRDDNKLRRFGDVFSIKSTANEKYEEIISQYKDLRDMASIQFEDNVIGCLHDMRSQNSKLAERLKSENEETLRALILPNLDEIHGKLEFIHSDVHVIKSDVKELSQEVVKFRDATTYRILEQQTHEKFEKLRKNLKATEVHLHQLSRILEPVQRRLGTAHLSRWLFDHEHYKSWANGNQRFLYIKGQPGFGKSVTVAVATERLLESVSTSRLPHFERHYFSPRVASGSALTTPQDRDCPVIFFFFKRGDDETQLADTAISCLLAQLFQSKYANTMEEKEALIKALDISSQDNEDKNFQSGLDSQNITKLEGDEEKAGQHETASSKSGPGSRSSSLSTSLNIRKLKRVAKAIGKMVYIVIDGIDECTDYESSNLISDLIDLGRSKDAEFKILLSSRTGLGVEKHFDETEPEGTENHEDPNDEDGADSIHCETRGDATILTVNKSTNEDDMRAYLQDCLSELLGYSPNDRKHSITEPQLNDNKEETHTARVNRKQMSQIQSMVETIQKKAEGMFTYSAMVIASLRQPSPLSIKRRVKGLPDHMDSLYSKHLESLTAAQRSLVILALKRMYLAPREMNTLEIIDHFKGEYLESEGYPDSEDSDDDGDDGPPLNVNQSIKSDIVSPIDIIEREMRKPEAIYTIRQLEATGREFFKFSSGKRTLDFVHKSVFDWIDRESEKADLSRSRLMQIADIFKVDEYGDMKITVPKFFLESHSTAENFQSLKDMFLDALIYTLEVLMSPKFQNRYLPSYYRLENPDSLDDPYLPHRPYLFDDAIKERAKMANENATHHRGELSHLDDYFFNVGRYWKIEDRKGPKWNKLHQLLYKFSQPRQFARWSTEFLLVGRYKLEHILQKSSVITPAIVAARFGWAFYLDFLVDNEKLNYNITSDLLRPSLFGPTILHCGDIFFRPESLEKILNRVPTETYKDNLSTMPSRSPFAKWFDLLKGCPNTSGTRLLVKSMTLMLKFGLEPNFCFNHSLRDTGIMYLQILLKSSDLTLISLILEKYAGKPGCLDLNCPGPGGNTALHTVWQYPFESDDLRIQIGKMLLEAGADPNAQNNDSMAPLGYATGLLHEAGVQLLLEYGANINDQNIYGYNAFALAVTGRVRPGAPRQPPEKVISMMKLLKKHGADINTRAKRTGDTPLMDTIVTCQFQIADVLLQMHKSETGPGDYSYLIKTGYRERETLLHWAAKKRVGGLEIAKFVIKNLNKDLVLELLEQKDRSFYTPFQLAALQNPDVSAYFVEVYYSYRKDSHESAGGAELWLDRSLTTYIFRNPVYIMGPTKSKAAGPGCEALITTRPYAYWLLHALATTNREKLIAEVVSLGGDPLERDEEGWDMFDWAYAYGQKIVVLENHSYIDYEARKLEWGKGGTQIKKWDTGYLSPRYTTEDGLHVKINRESKSRHDLYGEIADALITKYPVPPYTRLFYYEVTIPKGCGFVGLNFDMGYTTSRIPYRFTSYSNHMELAFSFNNFRREIIVSGPLTGSVDAKLKGWRVRCLKAGDTIGCGYDQEMHEIFWTRNGKHLGVAFGNVKLRLWPMLIRPDTEIYSNFGEKEFVWKGEGPRPRSGSDSPDPDELIHPSKYFSSSRFAPDSSDEDTS
ncbi:hypothetical protein TWF730_011124 [Orbilia blumenaviensis]|uniref:B30.2/SPRY domain-containing protein n=1 Tax=Orbilia blumenaviensis TaxID=1796055 RepID=A0AAV9UK89_9PEZI